MDLPEIRPTNEMSAEERQRLVESMKPEDAETVPLEAPESPPPGRPPPAGSPTPSEVSSEGPPGSSPTPVSGDTTPTPSPE